jgi:hypothetical protein
MHHKVRCTAVFVIAYAAGSILCAGGGGGAALADLVRLIAFRNENPGNTCDDVQPRTLLLMAEGTVRKGLPHWGTWQG